MAKQYEAADIQQAFDQLADENDRAVILVGSALLEDALEQVILSRLREPQKTERHMLFSERGILKTFAEKTIAAYFLKIIGPVTRRDIDLVREIRNRAAHNMTPVSFDGTPEIASRCCKLNIAKDSIPGKATPPDMRGMFTLAVRFLTANLYLRSGDSNAEIAEAFKSLAPYLDR